LNLDDNDEKILSALVLKGSLTTNRLLNEAEIPKATFKRHKDDLVEYGLIEYSDIPAKNPKKTSGRSYYAREYFITKKGREVLFRRKSEKVDVLFDFLERAIAIIDSNELRELISDEIFNEWVIEAIEDYAAREARYHNEY